MYMIRKMFPIQKLAPVSNDSDDTSHDDGNSSGFEQVTTEDQEPRLHVV